MKKIYYLDPRKICLNDYSRNSKLVIVYVDEERWAGQLIGPWKYNKGLYIRAVNERRMVGSAVDKYKNYHRNTTADKIVFWEMVRLYKVNNNL